MTILTRGGYAGILVIFILMIFARLMIKTNNIQNAIPAYLKNNPRTTTMLPESTKEVRHIGFLKVHKAASSTLQNMLYRFGLKRNLSFILPKGSHYLSKLKYSYNPIHPTFSTDHVTPQNNKYDILCNHVVFNYDVVSDLLHTDAVYIAIVREPYDLFLSAAYYYKFKWKFSYLAVLDKNTFITDLIRQPNKYEATTMAESMTYNPMAYDFGLEFTNVAEAGNITQGAFEEFLMKIGKTFRLVLLVEKFDESLILLKRYLNWKMEDILYVKNNAYMSVDGNVPGQASNVTDEDMLKFRIRNRFDYGIYHMFNERFEKQVKAEPNIYEETKSFQRVLKIVNTYCQNRKIDKNIKHIQLVVNPTRWNSEFIVSENDCNLMLQNELNFFKFMTSRQLDLNYYYSN